MADEQTDPLVALLDKSGLSVAQKRGLWDLYTAAKDTGDLQKRLDSLKLPDAVKHDLWNLKATEVETPDEVAEPVVQPTEPSEGYWEDRGIAGKVWHPASGVKEGNRVDNSILGVPPELAALGAGAVGRAVLKPGLNAAGRVAAGVTSAVGQAAPIVGYEAAHHGLRAVGVPEPFATIGAGLFGAKVFSRKGAPAAAEEAVAAETATVPKVGIPKTAESPLELTRRLKAEHRAAIAQRSGHPLFKSNAATVQQEFKAFFNPPKSTAEAAKNVPKLKVQETAMAMKLLKGGMKADEVMETILELRKMPVSWRSLPTDAEVASIIRARNAARIPRP